MSGHSKWSNIQHKKGKTDAERGKVFTKISREMIVAVKEGGSADPSVNSRLRDVIAKAKAANVPNDNIKRVLEKAGNTDTSSYENITYEGYGPNGAAVIVETMTDNRNRTASEMRHYFDKFGGNLGTSGCVAWSFEEKGVLIIPNEDKELEEDQVMMDCLEAGASDINAEDECFEVLTEPGDFTAVTDALTAKSYEFASAQVEKVPQTYIRLSSEEDIKNMQKLLDALEDNDDVQNVWHSWEQ